MEKSIHYDRFEDSQYSYGTRGKPLSFQATPGFRQNIGRVFAEIWQVCPYGKAGILTTAGLWVDKPGMYEFLATIWPQLQPPTRG